MPKNVEIKPTEGTAESFKREFLRTWELEYQTTMRLLKVFPEDKVDLRPHEKLRSARELVWSFTNGEAWMVNGCIKGEFDLGKPPDPPSTMKEIIQNYEKVHADAVAKVKRMDDEDLDRMIKFFVAPKKMGDVNCKDMLWMMILDLIHHRGQLTIYQRLAGGKVPSIYGPTADEPWR